MIITVFIIISFTITHDDYSAYFYAGFATSLPNCFLLLPILYSNHTAGISTVQDFVPD